LLEGMRTKYCNFSTLLFNLQMNYEMINIFYKNEKHYYLSIIILLLLILKTIVIST